MYCIHMFFQSQMGGGVGVLFCLEYAANWFSGALKILSVQLIKAFSPTNKNVQYGPNILYKSVVNYQFVDVKKQKTAYLHNHGLMKNATS